MFHIRNEGENIRQGFNFYPLRDTHNLGFVLDVYKFRAWIRYAKKIKRWHVEFSFRENGTGNWTDAEAAQARLAKNLRYKVPAAGNDAMGG